MKRTIAFFANTSSDLHHTARDARQAEFDKLIERAEDNLPDDIGFRGKLAWALRSGIYGSAADAFIAAARYLEQYRGVLTGAELDPEERKDDE